MSNQPPPPATGTRLRDLEDEAFIRAITGGNAGFFEAIQKPMVPEPPATSSGSEG